MERNLLTSQLLRIYFDSGYAEGRFGHPLTTSSQRYLESCCYVFVSHACFVTCSSYDVMWVISPRFGSMKFGNCVSHLGYALELQQKTMKDLSAQHDASSTSA